MDLKLNSYWRSSAAFRVRIALNLKQLKHEIIPLDLVKNGGEQREAAYTQKNPQQLVPVLEDGVNVLRQSLAIIEYLDEIQPLPPLLPTTPIDRSWVRALAMDIACDIHPLNNFRVMKYLHKQLKLSDQEKNDWYRHWLTLGLSGIETSLQQSSKSGLFCFGDQVTLADICLIPQLFNAKASGLDLSSYPLINRIFEECMQLPAFKNASWEFQVDYPK
jgi:maleylacetoacetate isomerase/maleylpyruvate isomerase